MSLGPTKEEETVVGTGTSLPGIDTWGTVGYLTEEQTAAFEEFKSKVSTSDLDVVRFTVEGYDSVALRYLRARQFNLAKSIQLLSESISKKETMKASYYASKSPEECVQCDLEVLKKWYPHASIGYDKHNRPIMFEANGALNADAVCQTTTFQNLVYYHWFTMERTLDQMFTEAATRGGPNISTVAVLDLKGLNSSHVSSRIMDHIKGMISIDNCCYPETLGKMFVINAPWLAVTSWEIVKRWLDPRTQAKIQIMGSGPDTTQRLLEYISIDDLPRSYGGNAPDLFASRPNIEYLQIARSSTIKKVISIASKQQLCIDAYFTEGDLQLEVYSSIPSSNTSTSVIVGEVTAQRLEPNVVRDYEVSVATTIGSTSTVRPSKPTGLHVLYDSIHKRPEGQTQPLRVQLDIMVDLDATIHVYISNTAKWSSKPVMLNIFTKTTIAASAKAVEQEVVPNAIAELAATSGREALPCLTSPILVQPVGQFSSSTIDQPTPTPDQPIDQSNPETDDSLPPNSEFHQSGPSLEEPLEAVASLSLIESVPEAVDHDEMVPDEDVRSAASVIVEASSV